MHSKNPILPPVLRAGIALLVLAFVPGALHASPPPTTNIIGNLTASDNGADAATFIESFQWLAVSFTMGSQAFTLSNAQIHFTGSVLAGTVFQIESDSGGLPSGTVLETLTSPTFSGSATTNYTFTASTAFTLNPNTKYWLVGTDSTQGGFDEWVASDPHVNPSGVGATYGTYASSSNAGGSWSGMGDDDLMFQVNGTTAAVPEPSSLALLGMVAAGTAGWRRRRDSRAVTGA